MELQDSWDFRQFFNSQVCPIASLLHLVPHQYSCIAKASFAHKSGECNFRQFVTNCIDTETTNLHAHQVMTSALILTELTHVDSV